ncbi:hypothetical protein N0V88_005414 [Collariella sp. IMI 366227]|nr:hypothetical protein N0V88_005414 [Collariella sp. IMI 366227]
MASAPTPSGSPLPRLFHHQPYEIFVSLTLPCSPPTSTATTPTVNPHHHALIQNLQPTLLNLPSYLATHPILHTTTRPALIPYTDPFISRARRLLFLPYHLLFPHRSASVELTLSMAEQTIFYPPLASVVARRGCGSRGKADTLPGSLLLEVQAGQDIQVYEASVRVVARLRG